MIRLDDRTTLQASRSLAYDGEIEALERRIAAALKAVEGISTERLESGLAEGLVLDGSPGPERWHSLAKLEGE